VSGHWCSRRCRLDEETCLSLSQDQGHVQQLSEQCWGLVLSKPVCVVYCIYIDFKAVQLINFACLHDKTIHQISSLNMFGGSDGSECNLLEYYVLYSGGTVPLSRPSMSEVRC
jgi:hypothetical protein